MSTFDNVQPEEFLAQNRGWRNRPNHAYRPDQLSTYDATCKIIREFEEVSLQGNTNNNHLKHIMEGLIV